jgi:signal transduction histidine kinase/CheY-like chemotaxis protein
MSLPYVSITWTMGAPVLGIFTLVGIALYLFTLQLNRLGFSRTARSLPLVVGTLSTWAFCLVLTPESQVQLGLFMIGLWAFVLFDARKEWPLLIGLQTFPAIVYCLIDLGFAPKISSFEPSPELLASYSTIIPITTFILHGAFLFAFYFRNQKNEDRLIALIERLEQAHRDASAAERSKSEFLAMMTHEIRTPLNGVLGCAELIKSQPLSTEQAHWLKTLTHSGDYLLDLLTSILEYAHLDTTRVDLHESAVELGVFVEETMDGLAPLADAKGLDIWLRESQGVPRTLLLDPGRLRVVLRALVDNAIKYTETGHVEVHIDYRNGENSRGNLLLKVTDTGIGVAPHVRDKIFGAFWQAEDFNRRSHSGIGIGLPLAKATVEAMGGTLELESSPGLGSCFTVKVPVSLPPVEGPHSQPENLMEKGVRVVVQSEPFARALRAMFAAWGHLVLEPDDPRGADVLVLDSRLDGCSEMLGSFRRGSEQVVVLGGADGAFSTLGLGLGRFVRKQTWFETLRQLFGESTARVRQTPSLTPAIESEQPPGRAPLVERLVIADDQLTNRTILKKIAERFAKKVILVENGKLAVEAWEKYAPEVILMDIQMPVMDGIEATRTIRSLETPESRPAIIAVTANALPNQRAQGFAAGLDEYLTKPIRVSELSKAIERLCPASTACAADLLSGES